MKKLLLSIIPVLILGGCQLDPQINQATRGYTEVEHKGRLYVMATPEAAEKLAQGVDPQMTITKIGYGPNKQTVVFQVDSDGGEYWRIQEYNRKHGKPSTLW